MAGDSHLEIRGASVRFGDTTAVDNVDLDVERGEIIALLGPSGCGKSTLLRSIAGLQALDTGAIRLDGSDLAGVPPHRRGIVLMFQTHTLFPHRSVGENVAFGLELRDQSVAERTERVAAMLATVGLDGYGERRIDTLSGGEAQRVALARTLAPEPAIVMLDEPMGSLDRLLRERLAVDIRSALRAENVTAIVVTHDQDEAFTIADRVAVMHTGTIAQVATPTGLRRSPASVFVAEFLGLDCIVAADVDAEGRFVIAGVTLTRTDWPAGQVSVVIPPEALAFVPVDGAAAVGTVGDQRFRGDHFVTAVHLETTVMTVHAADTRPAGSIVGVAIDPARLVLVANTGH